jgi:uncharacterized membrane protein YoaK (UPF0700 family)
VANSVNAIMADELVTPAATNPSALEPGAVDRMARLARVHARNEEWLAARLAMVAGFVDAYGIITYGVYLSFMSGNTTQTGYQTAEGAFGPASLSALAILFFVLGVVAAALAAIIGLTQLGFLSAGVHVATISFAMGVMNIALSRVGAQPVSLTFVTGTLSRVGSNLALALRRAPLPDAQGPWDTHLRRAMLLARIWAGFLAGALLSGVAAPRFGAWVLLAPVLILAAMAAFERPGGGAD